VITEESISVDVIQLALMWMRETSSQMEYTFSSIKTEKVIEPLLNWIVIAIPDRLIKLDLFELSSHCLFSVLSLLVVQSVLTFELGNKLQTKRSSGTFITVDC